MRALEIRREGWSLAEWTGENSSDLWAAHQWQKMHGRIPGGRKTKTEPKTARHVCASLCHPSERTPGRCGRAGTNEDAKADWGQDWTQSFFNVPWALCPWLTWACGGRRERHTVLGQSVPAGSTTSWHNNPERNVTPSISLGSLLNFFHLKKVLTKFIFTMNISFQLGNTSLIYLCIPRGHNTHTPWIFTGERDNACFSSYILVKVIVKEFSCPQPTSSKAAEFLPPWLHVTGKDFWKSEVVPPLVQT